MPNSHGTKKAWEVDKCRCEICHVAQRDRWAAKDERERERKRQGSGATVRGGNPPLRLVTRQGERVADEPQVSESRGRIPNSAPRTPTATPARAAAPAIEIPRLWSIYSDEPEYAEDHRQFLAQGVADIAANPETYYANANLAADSTKQEAKDFARLLAKFRQANPGMIDFNPIADSFRGLPLFGAYYGFVIYSPEYITPDEDEDEGSAEQATESHTEDATEPATEPGARSALTPLAPPLAPLPGARARTPQPWEQPAAATPRTPRPKPYAGPAQPRNVPMGVAPSVPHGANRQSDTRLIAYRLHPNSYGMCEAKLYTDLTFCSRAVGREPEWTYRVQGRPVCQDHYNLIRRTHPERCEYMRNGQWSPAPRN